MAAGSLQVVVAYPVCHDKFALGMDRVVELVRVSDVDVWGGRLCGFGWVVSCLQRGNLYCYFQFLKI